MNALQVLNRARFCPPLAQSMNRMPFQRLAVSNLHNDLLASPNATKSTNHYCSYSKATVQSRGLIESVSSAICLPHGFSHGLMNKVTTRYMSSARSKIDRLIENNKVREISRMLVILSSFLCSGVDFVTSTFTNPKYFFFFQH